MKQKQLLKRVAALTLAATMVVGELPYVSVPVEATETLTGQIQPVQIPNGKTIFTLTGNMTNPPWEQNVWENQMQKTGYAGVYSMNLTMPAYDEAKKWTSRFAIGAFNSDTLIAGWNRILLGVPTINVGDLGNGLLGDLTNLTQIRVATPVETSVTVYFDEATYGLAVLDENGNSVEYQIGWCAYDDMVTYYTPEQFAEMTWDEYITQLTNENSDCVKNLEKLGVTKIPNFVKLRDDLIERLNGTPDFYVSGDWQYRVLEDGTIEIVGYTGNTILETIVPEEIEGHVVTKIGDLAFEGNHGIYDVKLPDTIVEIGERAFYNCSGLQNINLPDGVEKIGKYAFYQCWSLNALTLPAELKEIEDGAFYSCWRLKNIQLPEKLSIIGKQAFYNTKIKTLIIPKNVTKIGEQAFAHCNLLNSVDILANIEILENETFLWCNNLTNVNISSELTVISNSVFMNCSSLENIQIPSSVTFIGDNAFSGCNRLRVVTIPEGIQELGRGIFNGCTRLYAVNLPKSLTKIKSDAFANCTNLTSIKIPSNVRSLGAGIFRDCSKLTEIKLPASLEYIQKDAFSRIPNLYNILVDEENNKYCSVNGILFSKNPYSLIACPAKKSFEAGVCGKNAKYALIAEGGTLVISGTNAMSDYDINYADDGAFGSSIANMNDYSLGVYGDDEAPNSPFALDYRIKDIVILGKKMTKIGDLAFYGCAGLTKLTIPPCITTIGTSAFYKCENLTDVEIGSEVTNIGDSAFDGCPNLTIHCEENSVAHKYAMLNSINYKFFAKNYIVSFDANGGANTSVDNKEVEENTAVGTLPTTNREGYIFKGWYTDKTAGTKVTEETVVKADMTVYAQWEKETTPIENAEVNVLSTDIIYDGTAKEAIVQVIVDNKVLKKDTDYTATYADNTKVGTAKVTITGIGNYIGTVTKTYEIKPATLKVENVTLKATEYIYDGSAKQADVIVKVGAATLVKDTDYKVAYANNTEAGTAAVTITGMGNYTGLVEKEYIIKPCSVESAELTLEATEVTFNGMEQSPAVQVTLGEKVLVNGTDYNVTYTNNKDKGLATVTVTGTGNYNGNIAKEYKINAYNIENAEVNILSTDVVYDGAAKNVKIQVIADNRVLKEVEDYSILYLTNTNAGTAKFGLVGHGNYTGSVVKTFEIKQATIKKSDVTVEATEYIYDGKEKKPSATVTINGKTLKKDVDYIVTYEENIEVGYGRTIITGIGNYAGTVERMLRIKKASLSSVELAKTEFIFSEEDQEPNLTVKSGNKKLKEDEDYEVYYKKNYGIGTAKVIVIGIGNYTGKLTESFKIMPQEVKEVTQTGSKSAASIILTWTATPGVSGYEIYRATSKNGDYTIVKYQSANTYKDVKLEADTKYYYKVRAYRTVNKVKYYGDFSKVISAETIVAAPEFTLTATEEAVTVNWDKSKGADGYEVYMASSKKATFKNIKSANTNGRKYKKTGLKSGKTYYFKVRAYQSDASGKKIYSAFSEIQEVTVK